MPTFCHAAGARPSRSFTDRGGRASSSPPASAPAASPFELYLHAAPPFQRQRPPRRGWDEMGFYRSLPFHAIRRSIICKPAKRVRIVSVTSHVKRPPRPLSRGRDDYLLVDNSANLPFAVREAGSHRPLAGIYYTLKTLRNPRKRDRPKGVQQTKQCISKTNSPSVGGKQARGGLGEGPTDPSARH
ncbi:hypothetical protein EVAR_64955_1 [Eumeta japonica]|uniref:Uncharacterized protein n=1 Tax=Eumeta variegata TaxID=151549 RepID=A0A4C1Z9L3_EUMVA|nr:hypothetical protein EVAR_64955_1 [Eumeta japonica]